MLSSCGSCYSYRRPVGEKKRGHQISDKNNSRVGNFLVDIIPLMSYIENVESSDVLSFFDNLILSYCSSVEQSRVFLSRSNDRAGFPYLIATINLLDEHYWPHVGDRIGFKSLATVVCLSWVQVPSSVLLMSFDNCTV